MADLTTLLSKFLTNLYTGTLSLGGSETAIVPRADNVVDWGSAALQWKTGYFGTQVIAGNGLAGAPSYTFVGSPTSGLFRAGADVLDMVLAGVGYQRFQADVFELKSTTELRWSIGALGAGNGASVMLAGAGSLYVTDSVNGKRFGLINQLTELTTIAAAASTDTTIQMPANAVVLGVSVRVTTVIPTAATFTVGDSGSAARFSTAAVSTAAASTDPGTKAGAYYNATALAVRITPNLQPADNTGRVRVTIYYYTVTAPTS